MRPGETLSLTVTLPNEQRIEVPEGVVWGSRGQEFAVENCVIELRTHARLQPYVKRLAKDSPPMISHRQDGCLSLRMLDEQVRGSWKSSLSF